MVRGRPPGMGHSVEMIRFFKEFTLSEILQSLLSFRMTIISNSPIPTRSHWGEGGGEGESLEPGYWNFTHFSGGVFSFSF